ncbi:zinc finger protein CONSTANS-LIKE 4 [Humulus lupulus]|uniref:zinc finger protein CONSTANS-LIKE 4 n=1 Tax=Humulus lupulus TaxID=3486 RepID=UPI002B403D72|nr:zinc finger protein CONSTANS-LIKE 4 [Humulus lupulus]
MASKLCDSCKSATATLYCRADAAFLCVTCDSNVHAANKLASLHARVWVCEVCEQAPAHVTCKADAAALCVTCDRDIHSANPLARRHERVPITPLYESVNSAKSNGAAVNFLNDRYFPEDAEPDAAEVSTEEAEAASWLLPNPKAMESPDLNSGQYVFPDMVPYLDLDYGHLDPKLEAQEQNSSGTDGVVPVHSKSSQSQPPMANEQCYEMDFSGSKHFVYGYNAQHLSHSVSSSSLDVGVVPDGNTMADGYPNKAMSSNGSDSARQPAQFSSADREARVLRYREKRKNRKFEKTIRYASRKAYAETRPRIKGRFAKRTEVELEADRISGYGVVPMF